MIRLATYAAVALLSAVSFSSARAAERPVVAELFTSQGCSSCPPANANLIRLAARPEVLPLSFSVTYWDRLGWKDTFGKPEFTERQSTYEPALGERSMFTPQVVVNGRLSAVGSAVADVDARIASARGDDGLDVSIASGKVRIGKGTAPQGGADVWLVRYDPRMQQVAVARGENANRTLPHVNVVRELLRIGRWTGEPAAFDVAASSGGLKTAVLVQAPNGGAILGAAR